MIRRLHRDESGQAATELAGMLIYLVLAALAIWQVMLVAWSMTEASNAARTGSRIVGRGGDPERAATDALTSALRDGSQVDVRNDQVTVHVRVPIIFPGFSVGQFTITRQAELPS